MGTAHTALVDERKRADSMSVNTLFISYDGMTDPLGQSQVIPYLSGLSKSGISVTLLSFEKEERYLQNKDKIAALLTANGIAWEPLSYTKKPPVLSTVWDVIRMHRRAVKLHQQKNFAVIHCRSYISALAGLYMKRNYATKFIFDMRGFWADERVDGGLWRLSNPLYKTIYDFFKRKEIAFLQAADHTISLTQNAKNEILSWPQFAGRPIPIQVIPCCADLQKFSTTSVHQTLRAQLMQQFGYSEQDTVLSYLGSLGTWYMLDEMLDLFKVLLTRHSNIKFLFITADEPEMVYSRARQKGIDESRIKVVASPYDRVATYLSLSKLSVFFIKPAYSKKASSPTKQGELMAMGIPMICNRGIGDVDSILDDTGAGYSIDSFTEAEYEKVSDHLQQILDTDKEKIKAGAYKYYSLIEGVKKYRSVYEALLPNLSR